MKALPWIVVGVGIGAALAYLIVNAPEPAYSTGDPDAERFARKASAWGTEQRLKGKGGDLLGKAKQGFGEAVGDEDTADKGAVDQVVGAVKDTAGKTAHAVSDTVREYNR